MSSRRSKRRPRQSDGLPDYVVNRMTRDGRERHLADLSRDVLSYAEAILDLLASEDGAFGPGQERGDDVVRRVLQTSEFYESLTGLSVQERSGVCLECGVEVKRKPRGRPRKYCSDAHKQAAYLRRAGLKAPPREHLSRSQKEAIEQWVETMLKRRYPARLEEIERKRWLRHARWMASIDTGL